MPTGVCSKENKGLFKEPVPNSGSQVRFAPRPGSLVASRVGLYRGLRELGLWLGL